ncbi:hypothetical protein ACTG9Q_02215 [Actinokineospora sp. 24-640]
MTGPVMTGPGVTNVTVGGGAGGTEAQYEDLAALGDLTDDVAGETLTIAMASHSHLVDPNVLASAVLNPAGVVRFEGAMLGALDGPSGLTATSAAIGLRGLTLQATNQAYQFADDLNAKALEASRWLAGVAATTPAGLAVVGGTGALVAADIMVNYDGDWQRWLVEHPGMVDTVLGMSPGALSALGLPTDMATLTELIAAAYPDGDPALAGLGIDTSPIATTPPSGIGDLMDSLGHRNGSEANIGVRAVYGPNGEVTGYIVDIPGTKTWNLPGADGGSANDLGTNVDGMAGNETVLQEGIELALADAGVPPGAPVMLVGHSQGGIVAARAANDLANPVTGAPYNVTHVVTAGSPVGGIDIPDGVQMLSLENSGDIVPHLDARDNPASDNRTTVTFDNQSGTITGNHSIEGNYTDVGDQLDNGADPSVRRFTDSAGAFLGGSSVQTHQYQVTRR